MEMKKNHKLFLRNEFFGSIVYSSYDKNYYFFDHETTKAINEIYSGEELSEELEDFKTDLEESNLLTSDIICFNNQQKENLSTPLRVFIDITYRCNLRCKHCFTDSGLMKENELSTEELYNLIDQMRQSGTFLLSIAGGEPLFRKDILDVIAYARKNAIDVSITTNGLFITEEIAKKMDELDLRTVTVSIDGNEKNHDDLRKKGSFKKAIEKLQILRKHCKSAKINIKNTVTNDNICDYNELICLSDELKLDGIKFNPVRLFGRTQENKNLLINQTSYIKFLKDVQKVSSEVNVSIPKTPLDKQEYDFIPIGFGCTGGKETCNISPTGEFSACAFLGPDFSVGSIKKEKFLDLWKKANSSVNYEGNSTCKNCEEYKNCRAGCRSRALSEYNNIDGIDPLCTLEKAKMNKKLSIREENQNFIVYDHDSGNYKKFTSFEDIKNTYPQLINNKQYSLIKNSISMPLKIFFDPTNMCNSKCIHCYNSSGEKKGEEISLTDIKKLANEMKKNGIFQVSIAGGEPFIRNDIFSILSIFQQMDIDISITTNGILLTEKYIEKLKKIPLKSLTISIDGVTNEDYEKYRGIDALDILKKNIKCIKKELTCELSMRFSVMKNNCSPKEVMEFASDVGFDCLKINKTHILGRFNENIDHYIDDNSYNELIEKFREIKDSYSVEIELPREKYLNKEKKFPCSAGKKTIYVSPSGKVLPCPFISSDYELGDITKEPLKEVMINSETFSVINDYCINCPAMKKSHNLTKKVLI
jgi:radical SAM protein with 4Fe4S-binding SPASM domain